MTLLVLAHAGHWLLSVLYVAPIAALLGWLVFTAWRERRAGVDHDVDTGEG